ncbi:MAG: hypothetical protein GX783_13945 [Clostridiales bacterium]|nr:hypothetical protein [Clostridiales bacterium]
MGSILKSLKWFSLLSGVVIAILGITILFVPLETLTLLVKFIGVPMLLSGISEIAYYFSEIRTHKSVLVLGSGILTILLAIWMLFGRGSQVLVTMLSYVLAVWVLTSSIMRVAGSLIMKFEGSSLWGWLLAFSIIGSILGVLLLFSPDLSATLISYALGLVLIAFGIENIIIFLKIKNIGYY